MTASTSCSAGCSDWGIEGTVTLAAEAAPDLATVSVTYNGYGSAFQGSAPQQPGAVAQQIAQITPDGAPSVMVSIQVQPIMQTQTNNAIVLLGTNDNTN